LMLVGVVEERFRPVHKLGSTEIRIRAQKI
jgi:hypothetical protein